MTLNVTMICLIHMSLSYIFEIMMIRKVTTNVNDINFYVKVGQQMLENRCTLGVPAMSRILTADSQKLSLSILRKVPFLIFWSDKPRRRTNSAHVAWSRSGTWAAWAEVVRRRGVSYIDKIYIFEVLIKNCSKYVSASQIGWNFLKVGTPNVHCLKDMLSAAAFVW